MFQNQLEPQPTGMIGHFHGAAPFGQTPDNSELDRFIYAITHDMKAGLRALTELPLWVEEDLDHAGIELPSDVQEHIQMMRSNATYLSVMLDGLVNLSRAGRVEDVTVRTTVQHIARKEWQDISDSTDVTLDTSDALEEVELPKLATATLFKAILENAITHHDKRKGHVCVASEMRDGRVFIAITDDGPGIPERMRDHVFEPLKMLRARDETGRAGLGLTIARKLVRKMGGEIAIDGHVAGRGTRVSFDLPARIPD